MVTLRNLYTVFGHDPKWSKLATKCLQPMITIYLRKLGDKDITTITDFDLQMQVAMSPQPMDVKVPAQSCMNHLRNWAKEQGKPFAEPEPEPKPKREPKLTKTAKPKPNVAKSAIKRKNTAEIATPNKEKPVRNKTYTKPEIKRATKHPEHLDALQDYNTPDNINLYDSESHTKPCTGTIYHDCASKGWKNGKRIFKDCWRAEITIAGTRYRHRAKEREDCEAWLKAVKQGKIKPTDNKADWWRMEQKKDESVRIDEIIVSQAEESVMLYDYHQTGDISTICEYLTKRLLPHMMYYAAHTLHLGKDSTIVASRQAAGLLLTRIIANRPVMNFTATCKRMLRVYKQRGDFFYYEKAPQEVKLMVNKINFDGLAEVWKVTKDRRI